MIEWRDEGVLLAVRKHGEAAVIVEVFTEHHGKHAGVVRGGAGRKQAPVLQPGGQFEVVWKARLEEHMGAFTVEPLRSRAAQVMADPLALAGLTSVVGLLSFALPEREVHGALYSASINLLDLIRITEAWPLAYLHCPQRFDRSYRAQVARAGSSSARHDAPRRLDQILGRHRPDRQSCRTQRNS